MIIVNINVYMKRIKRWNTYFNERDHYHHHHNHFTFFPYLNKKNYSLYIIILTSNFFSVVTFLRLHKVWIKINSFLWFFYQDFCSRSLMKIWVWVIQTNFVFPFCCDTALTSILSLTSWFKRSTFFSFLPCLVLMLHCTILNQ